MIEEVKQLLLTFARFEKDGTLPNTIHGSDVSNRDTSDAPLWFAVVCGDLADQKLFRRKRGRPPHHPRRAGEHRGKLFQGHAQRHPHGRGLGAHLEPEPFHLDGHEFPAGTPREGYPVEIQALWIRLLRLLEKIAHKRRTKKMARPRRPRDGFVQKIVLARGKGLVRRCAARRAARHRPRRQAGRRAPQQWFVRRQPRPCLPASARSAASAAAQKYLVVPGALRSLAPLPVSVPLPIYRDGQLLNNPAEPYWPRYEGDEDTRRKPAYHNGTAWTWTFPVFCEALASAWEFSPAAVAAAKSYLGSAEKLLNEGCLGQIPEILDGDAPHAQRGCDAQAWGVTETLRVWKLLSAAS